MIRATANPPPRTAHAACRGAHDAFSLVPAIAPMGIALGVALGEMGAPPLVSWLGAPLLVAGSAQLALMDQLDAGATVLAATLAALLVNSRFLVYGAALADRFSRQPRWFRWLGAHYVVDQTYGLVTGRIGDGDSDADFRRYFTTAGTLLCAVWTLSVGIGTVAGPVLPAGLPLEFVLPAMFLALIVPGLHHRSEVWAATAGGSLALAGLSPTASLFAGLAAGALLGVVSEEDEQ